MGLWQELIRTYDNLESKYVGIYNENNVPLVPISHKIVSLNILVTIDKNGKFIDAERKEMNIIIPVTEDSAAKSGDTIYPDPLSTELRFFDKNNKLENVSKRRNIERYEKYIYQLSKWIEFEKNDDLIAVKKFLENNDLVEKLLEQKIIKDINNNTSKELVSWKIEKRAVYNNKLLFESYISFYNKYNENQKNICMICGEEMVIAKKSPMMKIKEFDSRIKLISQNDNENFTYAGRFSKELKHESMSIGYINSQKIHSMLQWICNNDGVKYDEKIYICWNPNGKKLPKLQGPLKEIYDNAEIDYDGYSNILDQEILKATEGLNKISDKAIISGLFFGERISVDYYNELNAYDFIEKLYDWDKNCCWEFFSNGKNTVRAPSLYEIIKYAYGTEIKEKIECNSKVNILELLHSKIDKKTFPIHIKNQIVQRVSMHTSYTNEYNWENVLSTACAVLKKYYYDKKKEVVKMALEEDNKDISYQYGRLLAILDKIEKDTYDKEKDKDRMTNAMRLMSMYVKRPLSTFEKVHNMLVNAYYPKLKQGSRVYYEKLVSEIIEKISDCEQQKLDKPLDDTYIFGFYLQRKKLYEKKNNNEEEMVNE